MTTNQGIDVSTVRMQEIVPDAELTALRAQVEALRKGIRPLLDDKIMEAFEETCTTLYGSGTAWSAVTRHECVAFAHAILDAAMKGQS